MMFFQYWQKSTHHLHGNFLTGFLDLDDLETASQRGVTLEILLVFRPGCRRDGSQFAASQRGLEQIRGIALPRLPAGADQRVGFVNKQNDRNRGGLDFVDHGLQPILELTLHASTGLKEPQVENSNRDILQ
jgi:hypothetical protein